MMYGVYALVEQDAFAPGSLIVARQSDMQ